MSGSKLLIWIGSVLLVLAALVFAGLFVDAREQKEKQLRAAREMGVPSFVTPQIGFSDIFQSERNKIFAPFFYTFSGVGLTALVAGAVLQGRKPSPSPQP